VSLQPARWTKAQLGFFTGVNTWCALYLESERQVAAIAIVIGAYLTWLAPNQDELPAPAPWEPSVRTETSGN
jgi:hypothetical protein